MNDKRKTQKIATKLAHIGRPEISAETSVNPPISRASTLLFKHADDLYNGKYRIYGRFGLELHDALREAFCTLESGVGATLTASGKSANTLSILSMVESGDHILICDSAYGPVRNFCQTYLPKINVQAEFFPADAGAELAKRFRPNTKAIILESPGSLSMEIQDLPAICKIAREKEIVTIVDNTWSAGLVYNPLTLGADIVVHSATKYMGGHSDVLYGAVICANQELTNKVETMSSHLGLSCSPDDTYQVLRGFRTLNARFEQQAQTALQLAKYLGQKGQVLRVLHPALASHPQYERWKRDFSGSGCLFSIVLKPYAPEQVLQLLDALKLFGKGFSFGGYESLVIHCDPQLAREFDPEFGGPLIRISCGLEDISDLQNDWDQALDLL